MLRAAWSVLDTDASEKEPQISLDNTPRPSWLTFDCYGTLIQWDEGLKDAVAVILARKQAAALAPHEIA